MSTLSCRPSLVSFIYTLLGVAVLLQRSSAAVLNGTAGSANATSVGDAPNPDFVQCSPVYGTNIRLDSCKRILANIFPGRMPRRPLLVTRHKRREIVSTQIVVPQEYKDPERNPACLITLDLAGPPNRDDNVRLLTSTLREVVEVTLSQCVEKAGWGGFITYGLSRTGDGLTPSARGPGLDAPLFLTVTVTPSVTRDFRVGDTDPDIPVALQTTLDWWRSQSFRQKTIDGLTVMMNELGFQSQKMQQGGNKAWWDTQKFQEVEPTGVEYRCEGGLGSPNVRDCRQASYGFVRTGEEKITGDKALKFEAGECIFKAEVTGGEVEISWDALRAAADVLLFKCLDGDDAPGTGGRVVYTGAGSSRGYGWPDNLLMSMGRVEVTSNGQNGTQSAGPVQSGSDVQQQVEEEEPVLVARTGTSVS